MSDGVAGYRFQLRAADASPLAGLGAPALRLTSVFISAAAQGGAPVVTVGGVAVGVAAARVSLTLDGSDLGAAADGAVNPATGQWSVAVPVAKVHGFLTVRAKDQSSDVGDVAIVHVPPHLAAVPRGDLSNALEGSWRFLAGSSDRLVRTRSFSLLELVDIDPLKPVSDAAAAQGVVLTAIQIAAQGIEIELQADAGQYRDAVGRLRGELEAEFGVRDREHARMREAIDRRRHAAVVPVFRPQPLSLESREQLRLRPRGGLQIDARAATARLLLPQLDSGAQAATALLQAQADIADWILQVLFARPSRFGLCFDERFRFRPAGLVRGEPIYALGLDAGEEVQLTQSSETVRTDTFEQALERETESSLTLSSTWSTDAAHAFNENQSTASGWNIGGDAGLSGAPKLPLNVGVSGGYSSSQAAQNSTAVTVQNAFQMSQQAMARLRAQHKTRLEVESKTTIGATSVRALNNRGSVRPRRIDFFKMYRKEQVTYERYNARLCLRLVIDDPAATVRNEFQLNLDAIDPENEAHYAGLNKPREKIRAVVPISWALGGPVQYLGRYARSSLMIDAKAQPNGSVPAEYLMVTPPTARMEAFTHLKRLSWIDGGVTATYRAADDGVIETGPGVEVVNRYAHFGALRWKTLWDVNSPASKGLLEAEYERAGWIASGSLTSVETIDLNIISEWAPPSAATETYQQQRDEVRRDVADRLSEERVLEYRDIAVADYQGQVVARAMEDQLSAGLVSGGPTPLDFNAWFAVEDAYIESAPYWATAQGRDVYATLRSRLSKLDLGLPLSAILAPELTSAQAVLYLPIRQGAEEKALALLDEVSPAAATEVVDEFRAYHRAEFGATAAAAQLPSAEQVASPTAVVGTTLGEAAWRAPWEQSQRNFQVLAQWAEYLPTDGVDAQTVLSPTSKADEALLRAIDQDVAGFE